MSANGRQKLEPKKVGRRGALLGIGVAAAGVAGGLGAASGAATGSPDVDPTSAEDTHALPDALEAHALRAATPDVQALFGDLVAGAAVGTHWQLEAVYGVREGGIPVVLSTRSGERFAAEVFRADDATAPLASAGPLALYLVNRGDGDQSTDEAAGLGVRALARELEARLDTGTPLPDGLGSLSERRRRNPTGVFHVPV